MSPRKRVRANLSRGTKLWHAIRILRIEAPVERWRPLIDRSRPDMVKCSAAWYELNISAPENVVSACCYYGGPKDPWVDGLDLQTYWNSSRLQHVRRLNNGDQMAGYNGCASCYYYQNKKPGVYYHEFDLHADHKDLSSHQANNLALARRDFDSGMVELSCTPLRIYTNFGFKCNLACRMCHQVPRRDNLQRQVLADSVLQWKAALRSALDVSVIGGEPFALPEAVSFIRRFIDDPDYDPVRLWVFTNGTVHHKHIETLRRKRKLSVHVSLDSIQSGFEHIRVGGDWNLVERNMLEVWEMKNRDRPDWELHTNAMIMKTGIPLLPEFARWHVRHGIPTAFYDFINYRGTEDAYFEENILHNPAALETILGWQDHFHEAIGILRSGHQTNAADTLEHYFGRLQESWAAYKDQQPALRAARTLNDWQTVTEMRGAEEFLRHFGYSSTRAGAEVPHFEQRGEQVVFTRTTYPRDRFMSALFPVVIKAPGSKFRLRLSWRDMPADARRAHFELQGEQLGELKGTWYFLNVPGGVDAEYVGDVPPGITRLQLVARPVGEDLSVLPGSITLELEGRTTTILAPELPGGKKLPANPASAVVAAE